MSEFRVLIYEDDVDWKESFEYSIRDRVQSKGRDLKLIHKTNNHTVAQDLQCNAHLVMVDYDLIDSTGEEVIQLIDDDPDYKATTIFFYSGGETLDSLRDLAAKFNGKIRCFTKEGNELHSAVLNLI